MQPKNTKTNSRPNRAVWTVFVNCAHWRGSTLPTTLSVTYSAAAAAVAACGAMCYAFTFTFTVYIHFVDDIHSQSTSNTNKQYRNKSKNPKSQTNETRQLTVPASGATRPVSRALCRRLDASCQATLRRCRATVDTASRRSWACQSEHGDQPASWDFVQWQSHLDPGKSRAAPATCDVTPVPA